MSRIALVFADRGASVCEEAATLLRRRGHHVEEVGPEPEARAAVERSHLPVYRVAGHDAEDPLVWELAIERPGVVLLRQVDVEGVVRGLVRQGSRHGVEAVREAAAVSRGSGISWCARLVRVSRALVVFSAADAARVGRITRNPVHTAPAHEPSSAAAVVASAVETALREILDPARTALRRWAVALTDAGVAPEALQRGYGSRYARELEAILDAEGGPPA